MMSKKDYERAATIVQDLGTGDRADNEMVTEAFVELFRDGNGRFDEDQFRRACVPGANVRARSSFVKR